MPVRPIRPERPEPRARAARRRRRFDVLLQRLAGVARATGGHHPTPTATPKPTPTPTPKPAATPKPTGTPIVPPTPTPLPTGVQPIFGCLHCPLKVTFREPEDFLGLQGEIGLPPSFDPSGSNLLIEVFNAGGTVYAGELFPGDLQRKGRKFQFKDRPAKTGLGSRDGIFKAQIKPGKSGLWRIKVKIFDDLSAATVPEMTVRITMSGMVFEKSATWQSNAKGYLLDRLPLS